MSTPVLDIGCPITSASPRNQDLFSTAYHSGVIKRLATKVEADPVAAELFEQVLVKLQGALPVTSFCWQPEIGAVMQRLDENDARAAVMMALFAMHALRVGGEWQVQLLQPTWGSVGGHIFEVSGLLTVSASADRIEIATSAAEGSPLALVWTENGWRLDTEAPHAAWKYSPPRFVDFDGFRDVYVHAWEEPVNAGPDLIVNWPIPRMAAERRAIADTGAANIAQGLAVLAKAGPQYLRWVRPLFRGVAATPLTHDDMRQSGSYTAHPGVFNCGFPGGAESLAEVIVHEISHQNFLLLSAVFPLARDHDGERFFSSLKGSERPLSRVLLAYHAAANMALYWDDLSKHMSLNEYYVAERLEMNRHADSLAAELGRAKGLTEAGELLFRTQDDLLKERGLVAC